MSASELRATRPMALEVRTDVAAAEIDRYVAAHPRATGYHLSGWTRVIERAFGHRTQCLVATSEGRTTGVLPLAFFKSRLFGRFAVSLPFLNYGGVVADGPEVEQALLERAIEETRRHGGSHLELRHSVQTYPALTPKRHKVSMRLGLAHDAERQWELLDRKVRNQIRKGEKSNLEVAVGSGELLDAFYTVFARNMRDLGTPVYSPAFFREVLAEFPETARVFVVRHEDRPLAASIVYGHGPMIEVPWASALRESNPLSANMLLYWHMLKFSIERGYAVFDFGRSTPNEGTFHFKRQWGAEPHPLVWEYWTAEGKSVPEMNPKNQKFDLAIRAWQRLPLPVASTLGPLIVRNIP